jgi:hypothetical protein
MSGCYVTLGRLTPVEFELAITCDVLIETTGSALVTVQVGREGRTVADVGPRAWL